MDRLTEGSKYQQAAEHELRFQVSDMLLTCVDRPTPSKSMPSGVVTVCFSYGSKVNAFSTINVDNLSA